MDGPDGTVRAAVVGCGRIGSTWDEGRPSEAAPLTHAGALARSSRIHLVAGADPVTEQRERFTLAWGVPAYADIREMLDSWNPEWVSVCTPPDTHLDVTLAALKAGARVIFCEKPLADSLAAGRQLVDACASHDAILAVGYQRRWDPGHQQAARWIAEGRIGKLQRAIGTYVRGLGNNGSHLVDLVRMMVGEVQVIGAGDTLGESDADPSLDVTLSTSSGVPVTLLPLRRKAYDVMELDVFGERGRVSVRDYGNNITLYSTKPLQDLAEFNTLVKDEHWEGPSLEMALGTAVEDILRCLDHGGTPSCTGADGLAALEVVEKARTKAQ